MPLPLGNSWPLHVLHSEGEKSKGNYGYFERDSALKSNEPLMATVILYLSNVTRGGQILFPESEVKESFVVFSFVMISLLFVLLF